MLPVFSELDDYLFFIVVGVFGLIKFIGSKMSSGTEEEGGQQDDPEKLERTRQIQEEIRRRLAQRQAEEGLYPVAPQTVEHRPVAQQPAAATMHQQASRSMHQEPVIAPRSMAQAVQQVSHAKERNDALSMMERLEQAQRDEQSSRQRILKALAASKKKGLADAALLEIPVDEPFSMEMLHRPGALRNAIIMAEIIGGPISERKSASCPGMAD